MAVSVQPYQLRPTSGQTVGPRLLRSCRWQSQLGFLGPQRQKLMGPSFLLHGPQEEALLEGILLGTWSGKLALRAVELVLRSRAHRHHSSWVLVCKCTCYGSGPGFKGVDMYRFLWDRAVGLRQRGAPSSSMGPGTVDYSGGLGSESRGNSSTHYRWCVKVPTLAPGTVTAIRGMFPGLAH